MNARMGKKVLFVDDEEEWRSMVDTSLGSAGFDVLVAKDASDAMRLAEGAELGLILLDLNLGGENGLMLVKFLKLNHPGVPIVLYSDLEHEDAHVLEMLKAGVDLYLQKGSMEELILNVGAYVQ
jgi:two-component system response regulator RegA